jgi:hypothetical protein
MITHLQQKAFVRKYNSELAIKGYTKLTRASLFQRIENTLKRSRTELKREWASMKSRPSADSNMAVKRGPKRADSNMAVKRGPKRADSNMAVKRGPKRADSNMAVKRGPKRADSNMAVKRGPKRADSNMAVKRGPKRAVAKPASAKRASAKPASAKLGPKKGPVKFTSKIVVAPGAQSERLNDATDRITNKLKGNYYNQSTTARKNAIRRDTALARRIRG